MISGGWELRNNESLTDTWTFDFSRNTWSELPFDAASAARQSQFPIEAHKGLMTGCDMVTFGGHEGPGEYHGPNIDVHMLRLGGVLV